IVYSAALNQRTETRPDSCPIAKTSFQTAVHVARYSEGSQRTSFIPWTTQAPFTNIPLSRPLPFDWGELTLRPRGPMGNGPRSSLRYWPSLEKDSSRTATPVSNFRNEAPVAAS